MADEINYGAHAPATAIIDYGSHAEVKPLADQPASLSGAVDLMGDQAKRAIGAAWDTISSVPNAAFHPIDTLSKAFDYTTDAIGRVKAAVSAGDKKEAAMSAIGAIPLAGPQLEQITREVDQGKYAEAIGHAAAARAIAEAPGAIADAAPAVKAAAGKVGDIATRPGVVKAAGAAVGGGIGYHIAGGGGAAVGAMIGRELGGDLAGSLSKDAPIAEAAPTATAAAAPPPVTELIPADWQAAAKSLGAKSFEAAPQAVQDAIRKSYTRPAATPPPNVPSSTPTTAAQAAAIPAKEALADDSGYVWDSKIGHVLKSTGLPSTSEAPTAAAVAQQPAAMAVMQSPTNIFAEKARYYRAQYVAALAGKLNEAGIGPENIASIMTDVKKAAQLRSVATSLGIDLPKDLTKTVADLKTALEGMAK